jgi:uncharacterized protein (TIGR00730 family)
MKAIVETGQKESRRRLCVFCGSSPGLDPAHRRAARELGGMLVPRGWDLVYGGARVGVMGAVADAVLAAGGDATGVIPRALVRKEVAHDQLTSLEIVGSMHERKQRMAELADAFVALPGGMGTLEELFETLTWAQLGMHSKPCGLLNVDGYFDPLLDFLDCAVEQRFVSPAHRRMILVARTPRELLDRVESYEAPQVEKWLDRGET